MHMHEPLQADHWRQFHVLIRDRHLTSHQRKFTVRISRNGCRETCQDQSLPFVLKPNQRYAEAKCRCGWANVGLPEALGAHHRSMRDAVR
jgi:hypothetical protein